MEVLWLASGGRTWVEGDFQGHLILHDLGSPPKMEC
jgi:hypothetical protein